MNNDNLNFIRQSIRYLGFGEAMTYSEQLEEGMRNGVKEFQLKTAASFDEWSTIQATLYFKKADSFDMYFFNKYEALLLYDNDPKYNKMQTFYINKGRGVTFKEAFNLLQGRAVYKNLTDAEGVGYNAWLQLSFKERTPNNTNYKTRQFGERYGYDLEKALRNYPIREMQNEQLKQNLLHSLRKGNVHPVTFAKSDRIEKMFIEACPEFKIITIYSELTRTVERSSIPKEERVKPAVSAPPPDPEGSVIKGEKEDEKKEEKEPPGQGQKPANEAPVKKRNRPLEA